MEWGPGSSVSPTNQVVLPASHVLQQLTLAIPWNCTAKSCPSAIMTLHLCYVCLNVAISLFLARPQVVKFHVYYAFDVVSNQVRPIKQFIPTEPSQISRALAGLCETHGTTMLPSGIFACRTPSIIDGVGSLKNGWRMRGLQVPSKSITFRNRYDPLTSMPCDTKPA